MDRNQDGNGAGLIVEIVPIPTYTCTIEVRGATPADKFEARLGMIGNPHFIQTTPFQGNNYALSFTPGSLELKVYQDEKALMRIEPPEQQPLEFFDDCNAVYQKNVTSPRVPPEPLGTKVSIAAAADLYLQAKNLALGTTQELNAGAAEELAPGDYLFTLHERGTPISRSLEKLTPGREISIGDEPLNEIQESITRNAAHGVTEGAVSFSESLGPISNRDLGLWLSLMGVAHITKDPNTFSALGKVKLDDVTAHVPNSSGVYTLAAIPGASR